MRARLVSELFCFEGPKLLPPGTEGKVITKDDQLWFIPDGTEELWNVCEDDFQEIKERGQNCEVSTCGKPLNGHGYLYGNLLICKECFDERSGKKKQVHDLVGRFGSGRAYGPEDVKNFMGKEA